MKMRATGDPEQFGFLLLPSFSMMAFASAVEPLRAANTIAGRKLYEWTMISMDGQAVPASNSIDIMPNTSVATEKHFDYLFVVGGTGAEKIRDPRALNFVRKLTRVGTVIGAVSTAPYLLAYAGLQSIPDAYYQAAKIDQASRWKVFRYIELPKMMGVLMIAILLRFMDSFMIYTEPFVVTGGGPGNSTTFLSIDLVKMALGQFDLGPAAAFSIMYYLVILLISYVFYTVMTNLDKRDGH